MYRLGYVAEPEPGDEDMRGRLAIPYLSPNSVLDLRFRTLTMEGGPKYLSHHGSHARLFNVNALRKPSETLVLCEGELDTIILDGMCGIPAVGVPGASNWQKHFPLLLRDYYKVVVLTDGDQAGRDFGKKVVASLNNAIVVPMPDGMDANDYYLAHGVDGIKSRVGVS